MRVIEIFEISSKSKGEDIWDLGMANQRRQHILDKYSIWKPVQNEVKSLPLEYAI